MTYEFIGRELGVSTTSAYYDVRLALREITREDAEDLRAMEEDRLDEMLLRLNTELNAVIKARQDGEVSAERAATTIARVIESQLRISDRRARMLGLDAPQQVQLANQNVDLDGTVAKIIEAAALDDPSPGGDNDAGGGNGRVGP